MADISNELIYDVLRKIRSDVSERKQGQRETNARLNVLTTQFVGLQQDISNIYATLPRHDPHLDRIERRLEIAEVTS
jgi:hypothetical protein